jgi:hypothetical protein
MIILDSDIFTLLHYKHPNVVHHYEAVAADERLAVTAVTRSKFSGAGPTVCSRRLTRKS